MSTPASLPSQLKLDSIDITSVRLSADEESQPSTLCESTTNTDSTKVGTDECSIPTLTLAKKPALAIRHQIQVSLKNAVLSFGLSLQSASCDIG
jgi:hypothetical protein